MAFNNFLYRSGKLGVVVEEEEEREEGDVAQETRHIYFTP